METLDLTSLAMVKHIVDEGSVSKAAAKMFRSQSALSHKLRQLETELGFPLFLRRGKKLILTDKGSVVFTHAARILPLFEDLKKAVDDAREQTLERIRVMTACYTTYHWLPSVIKKYRSDNPGVEIEIRSDAGKDFFDLLEANLVDLVISDCRSLTSSKFRRELLFEDEFILLVSPGNPFSKSKTITRKDLDGMDLIMFDVPEERSTVLNAFIKPLQIRVSSVTRLPLTEGIMEMVSADLGIAMMPAWIARPYIERKQVVELRIPGKTVRRNWYVYSHPHLTTYQKKFIKLLQTELRPMLSVQQKPGKLVA